MSNQPGYNRQPRGLSGVPNRSGQTNQMYNNTVAQQPPGYQNRQNQNYGPQQHQRSAPGRVIAPSIFSSGYEPKQQLHVPDGQYFFQIFSVETVYTQRNHEPMIKITLVSDSVPFKLTHNIIKNAWFDINMTIFFDCFGIPYDNFNFDSWISAAGMIEIAKNGKYTEIVELIPKDSGPDLPGMNIDGYDNYVPNNQQSDISNQNNDADGQNNSMVDPAIF